jgi:hypothetical protein
MRITPEIREQARNAASTRYRYSLGNELKTRIYKPSAYDDFEINFMGSIGEICFEKTFPKAIDNQPILDTREAEHFRKSDFILHGVKIELKTQRFPRGKILNPPKSGAYSTFLINKDVHERHGDGCDIYVLCAIDDVPDRAEGWYLLGWIESWLVSTFDLFKYKGVTKPAYGIPLGKIKPARLLHNSKAMNVLFNHKI